MKLKVCGLKYRDNILEVAAMKPDYMGFIFYDRSRRYVGRDWSNEITAHLPHIKKVGVFVNAPVQEILEKVKHYGLDFVQLHGDESPEFCKTLGREVRLIKAFGIHDRFDFTVLTPYEAYCTFFLFDTQSPQHGGTGKTFDWKVLAHYNNKVPFFLSGGIGLEHVEELRQLSCLNIHAIDVNSRFESGPGLKDPDLLKALKQSGYELFD